MSSFGCINLINQKNHAGKYLLSQRIVTLGTSSECTVHIDQGPEDTFLVQLLYTDGGYTIQQLYPRIRFLVNDKKVKRQYRLKNGDVITIGDTSFAYSETAAETDSNPLFSVIKIVVSLLKNRDQDLSVELVTSIARLLYCDASRLVVWDDAQQKHHTIATFPSDASTDRFSTRAIQWAHSEKRTVLMHDFDWKDQRTNGASLETNYVASVLCAELTSEENILGYLYLDRLQGKSQFCEADRKLCDALVPLFSEMLLNNKERYNQAQTIARLQKHSKNGTLGLIYQSKPMEKIIKQAQTFASTNAPVLILGETGTGKELMARFIHNSSPRSNKPFRAINCGAIPANLIESELFGYEKGAFTGASKRTIGLFEATNGGTVFLDEIGEMPIDVQVKLLRVLQESEITRLGGHDPLTIDVRIIAATNRDLDSFVKVGKFRQDLYFRLNVLSLTIPPLSQRGHDILLLAEYFIDCYCLQFGLERKKLSLQAQTALISYSWPGNVRELENVIQKAILLSPQKCIEASVFPTINAENVEPDDNSQKQLTLKEVRFNAEKEAIENALTKTAGNISMASKVLDIDRAWLNKRINDYGIKIEDYRK